MRAQGGRRPHRKGGLVIAEYRNIIVTGGCGFIGSNFLRHVVENHPEVHATAPDKLIYAGNPENIGSVAKSDVGGLCPESSIIRTDAAVVLSSRPESAARVPLPLRSARRSGWPRAPLPPPQTLDGRQIHTPEAGSALCGLAADRADQSDWA